MNCRLRLWFLRPLLPPLVLLRFAALLVRTLLRCPAPDLVPLRTRRRVLVPA